MDNEQIILKAGFAKACITPSIGTPIPGYFYERFSEGVLDDIYATCLAFDDGEKKCLIYSVDTIGCTQSGCDAVKKKLNERFGIDEKAIYIAATHSHTAFNFDAAGNSKYDTLNAHNKWMFEKFIDLAFNALNDLTEVTAILGSSKDVYGVAFIRKYLMKDGSYIGHPKFQDPNIVKEVGNQDYEMQFLRILRKEAKEILLCSFGTHADTLGGNLISGDWPTDLTNKIEKTLDVNAITLVGTQGNSNTSDKLSPAPARKKEHTYGYYMHKRVANKLLAAILDGYEDAEELPIGKIGYEQKMLDVGINTYEEGQIEIAREMEKIYSVNKIVGTWDPLLKDFPISHVRARRILRTYNRTEPYHLLMSALNIGDIVFCGISGEPYCEIGLEIKKNSPFKMTFVTCQTNGGNGYFPDVHSMSISCYESDSSNYDPHISEMIANIHTEMTNDLYKNKN